MREENKIKKAFERGVKEKRLNNLISLLTDDALDILYNRMVENQLTPTAEDVVKELCLTDERRLN